MVLLAAGLLGARAVIGSEGREAAETERQNALERKAQGRAMQDMLNGQDISKRLIQDPLLRNSFVEEDRIFDMKLITPELAAEMQGGTAEFQGADFNVNGRVKPGDVAIFRYVTDRRVPAVDPQTGQPSAAGEETIGTEPTVDIIPAEQMSRFMASKLGIEPETLKPGDVQKIEGVTTGEGGKPPPTKRFQAITDDGQLAGTFDQIEGTFKANPAYVREKASTLNMEPGKLTNLLNTGVATLRSATGLSDTEFGTLIENDAGLTLEKYFSQAVDIALDEFKDTGDETVFTRLGPAVPAAHSANAPSMNAFLNSEAGRAHLQGLRGGRSAPRAVSPEVKKVAKDTPSGRPAASPEVLQGLKEEIGGFFQ